MRGSGVELAVDKLGDPSDPAVVFLHGGGQSRRAWDEAALVVAGLGWHAVTVDHRGHGDSEWPGDGAYEWNNFADDVITLVEQFESAPVLVGASLGGIAALLAQGESDVQLFSGLVLVDVTPRLEVGGVQRILSFMAAHPEGFATLSEASEVISDYTGRPRPESPEALRQVLKLGEDDRWHWHWDPRFLHGKANVEADVVERLRIGLLAAAKTVRVPTLAIRGGDSDLVSPEAVKELVAVVPGCQYVDVADAGHMVAGDQNDRFVKAVAGFLTQFG